MIIICVLQIDKIYKHIMPAWKKLFEEKKLWKLFNVQFSSQPLERRRSSCSALFWRSVVDSDRHDLKNKVVISQNKFWIKMLCLEIWHKHMLYYISVYNVKFHVLQKWNTRCRLLAPMLIIQSGDFKQ